MNIDDLHATIEQQAQFVRGVADETLAAYLQPVQERQFVVKVREMSPQDMMAVMMAKGPGELGRLMQEAARLEAKHNG